MRKKYLLLCLALLLVLFTGCENKKSSLMKCTKKEPFDDTQIEWNNNLEIKYDANNKLENALIKHIIKLDPSITDERKEEFKNSIYKECSTEPGTNFDICDIVEDKNSYTVKLSTNNLVLLDSAISKNEEQDIDSDAGIKELKTKLEEKGYVCEVE